MLAFCSSGSVSNVEEDDIQTGVRGGSGVAEEASALGALILCICICVLFFIACLYFCACVTFFTSELRHL